MGKKYQTGKITEITQEIANSSGTATVCEVQFSKLFRRVQPKAWGPWYGDVKLFVEGFDGSSWTTIYSTSHYFTGTVKKEVPTQEWYTMSFVNNTAYEKYRVRAKFSEMTYLPNSSWSTKYPGGVTMNVRLPIIEDGDPFADLAISGNDRCIDVAYMAGKFFYLAGDTVLFSQNIKDDGTGYDNCYQDSDPTSEEISDVYPTDGGYIKFNTMGEGLALKTFNRGVLVFGRDVVWGLVSPLESRFTATDYDTVELSRAGLIGAQSVVSVANFVYYWSPLGIFRVGVNPNTGSTMVAENISQQTIQSFYNNISKESKTLCRGTFDYCNNRIYWFYPSDPENYPENLDKALVYDLNYNAFMPQDVSEGGEITAVFDTINSYEIQPTVYLRAGEDRVIAGDEKVVAIADVDSIYNRHTAVCHCALMNLGNGAYDISYNVDLSSGAFSVSNVYGKLNTITISCPEEETATIVVSADEETIATFTDVSLSETPTVLTVDAEDNHDQYKLQYTLTGDIHAHVSYNITPENDQFGITFADFNDREFRDWDQSQYESYMVSHPISIEGTSAYGTEYSGTFAHKQVPILQTLFNRTEEYKLRNGEYTTPSGAYLRMRWGWSLNGLSNRWDIVQNAYRPQKDFLHDEYVESRLHIRGRGRAYQIELRNDSNKDFRLAGMNSLVRNYAIGSVQG